jgi:hypothetical protein
MHVGLSQSLLGRPLALGLIMWAGLHVGFNRVPLAITYRWLLELKADHGKMYGFETNLGCLFASGLDVRRPVKKVLSHLQSPEKLDIGP